MDFNASLVDIFVTTKLVYVATLHLTGVSSGFVVGFSQHSWHVFNLLPLGHLS